MALKTVNELYKESKTKNVPLLSNINASFWTEYVTNFATYDRVFDRLYRSFRYFVDCGDDTASEVQEEFTADVHAYLLINSKKYEELFRVVTIVNADEPLTGNVNLTVSETLTHEGSGTDVTGERTNTNSETIGGKTDTVTSSKGAYTDSKQEVLGEHSDNGTETVGTHTDNVSTTLGARSDTTNFVKGSENDSTLNKVSPYDTENFYNESQSSETLGSRTDNTTFGQGAQSNSEQSVYGAQSNSNSVTHTQQTNSETHSVGSRSDSENIVSGSQSNSTTNVLGQGTDTHSNEYTDERLVTKQGNDGRFSPIDLLEQHTEYWSVYEFYTMIFRDICKELLLISDKYY